MRSLVLLALLPGCAALSSWDGFVGPPADKNGSDREQNPTDGNVVQGADAGGQPGQEPPVVVPEAGTPAPITFVQATSAVTDDSVSSMRVTLQGQRAGDLVVVAVGWFDGQSSVASVADANGAYQLAAPTKLLPGSGGRDPLKHAIFFRANVPAAASNTITVTWNGNAGGPDIRVLEYSGLDPQSPLDGTAAGAEVSASVKTTPLTTRFAREVLVSAAVTNGEFSNGGAGHNVRIITTDTNLAQDRIVNAIGTYTAEAPLPTSTGWVMQVVGFH
jgi:hypothetical protein